MASTAYGPVRNNNKIIRDDEDGLVDEWGMRYEGHHKPGGGTFTRKKASRRKRFLLFAGAGIILVIVIVIIAVAVQKHSGPAPHPPHPPVPQHIVVQKYENKSKGLIFYPEPEDGFTMIRWRSRADQIMVDGYGPYMNSLDFHMHDYQAMNQQDKSYIECTKNNTPADKICQFDPSILKPCDHYDEYGYSSGTPCVMLQLRLPMNATAEPFEKDSEVGKMLNERHSPDHLGVTCDGVTEEDRKHISQSTMFPAPIQYFPPEGFPAYWFRPRTIEEFLPPVVMVKFNSIEDSHYVHIKCTVWGKNFNDGHPENSTEFSASFVFYHV